MTTTAIKKQVDDYLPMLSPKQQALVLEMIKSFLNVDTDSKRISSKQYNKELDEAVARIEQGKSIPHNEVLKEASKW
jgi:hypothetical protein